MNSNTNLLTNILSFLNAKDLSNVELVNKNYNQNAKKFDYYWREACNEHFCSYYEHYKLFDNKQFDKTFKGYFEKCCILENSQEWKKLFQFAIEIRSKCQNFNFSESLSYLRIEEDFRITETFISSTLKDFLALPKLRRENFYLQTELNSPHQIHNLEFLYEQQDLYDYYELYFKQAFTKDKNTLQGFGLFENNMYSDKLEIRREDLPFATLLQNYMDILCLYNKNDNVEARLNFGKLRWYACNDKFVFGSQTKEEELNDNPEMENPINFILKTITAKVIVFCRITLNYIKKYKYHQEIIEGNNSEFSQLNQNLLDKLFLNEFIKRNKAFTEAAIHINEEMENLNVLVNFLYEHIFPNYPSNPKFSIYRLMVVIWNKEVLQPLINTGDENLNLIKRVQNVYEQYLIGEIKRNIEINFNITNNKDNNSCFSSTLSSFSSLLNEYNFLSDNSRSLNCSTGQDFSYELNLEYYSSDMTSKYLIEQACSAVLDADCNEYSVFYVNYSKMKISQNYNNLKESLMETTRKVINHYFEVKPESITTILNFFSYSETNIRFINSTKIQLLNTICQMCVQHSIGELVGIFRDFLQNNLNNINEKEAENYLKFRNKFQVIIDDGEFIEDTKKIQQQFMEIALGHLKNSKIAEFATDYFIKELKKSGSFAHSQKTIQEALSIYRREEEKILRLNTKILKENKRRNITFDHSEQEEYLLKYENIDLNELDQIFIKSMNIDTDIFNAQLEFREQTIDENMIYIKNNHSYCVGSDATTLNSSYDYDYGVEMELDL